LAVSRLGDNNDEQLLQDVNKLKAQLQASKEEEARLREKLNAAKERLQAMQQESLAAKTEVVNMK